MTSTLLPVLVELRTQEELLRRHLPGTAEELALDPDAVERVGFHLAQTLEACVELASRVAVERGWTPPAEFPTAMDMLGASGLADAPLVQALRTLGAFRRASAEGYTGIDVERLHDVAAQTMALVTTLLERAEILRGG
ncbi:MAG: HepT-like ribonuclease domain-containing protein [Myxococcota bacterium]